MADPHPSSFLKRGLVHSLTFLKERARFLLIAIPLLWLLIFFLLPFLNVFKISFSELTLGLPPYRPLMEWFEEGVLQVRLSLSNYTFLLSDDLYVAAYFNSIKLAALATVLTLLIGYPFAYLVGRCSKLWRMICLMLLILPFWTSFLLRTYAWIGILERKGILNSLLLKLGLINTPLPLLYSDFAVCLGMVYCYLPFMVFPIFATLEKLDKTLIEAASDLGAPPLKTFLTVTLPLSLSGILTGSMLVFIPSVGEFVIPELLGSSENLMIGKVLWVEFFTNRDWPLAAAVAVLMVVFLVMPILILQKLQVEEKPQ